METQHNILLLLWVRYLDKKLSQFLLEIKIYFLFGIMIVDYIGPAILQQILIIKKTTEIWGVF